MKKIVVGGQIDKQAIAALVEKLGGDHVSVEVKGDLDAAMAMKAGEYDYYVGACNTGGGGALAMAMAMLGPDLCSTVSMPGSIKDESFMVDEVSKGKKAFGFTAQHAEHVLPILIREFIK
ncbi:DUF2620 domain-containing protein [Erysipelothrix sp. HDW6C]|uniref:DUF2620 domain-containing protein n=1 Tax=Erysipelothrix sp. HDW6C TaxID=2714930 RepID=UPI00140D33AF|nr:DUF2620 domain-containing protein [Erysipelothrix sp. HDW6C]QIK70408.1 DUF2620 domain-containing protein [Erysipelothrix sp. HDW6C]